LSWNQVKGIFGYRFSQEKKDWGSVKRVSIDEISSRKGYRSFSTVVCDIDHSTLLEADWLTKLLSQNPESPHPRPRPLGEGLGVRAYNFCQSTSARSHWQP
jgi:hypothetical protein